MTDKLHCPYCGEELSNDFGVIFCYNEVCEIYGCELNERVIRDIIDGKKAQDALKVARNLYQELALAHCEMADDYRTTYGCLKTPEQETQEYMQEYDEKIASITKQEI